MGSGNDCGVYDFDHSKKISFLREQKSKIELGELSPVLTTLSHILKHISNGGNLSEYIPLVRTSSYAGKCRRKKSNAAMPNGSDKDAGYARRSVTC